MYYTRHVVLSCCLEAEKTEFMSTQLWTLNRRISSHITSRHDTTRVERVVTSLTIVRWARCYKRVESCLFQHGGRRRSSSARVYKFSLLCSGFEWISGGTTSVKSKVDMSTPVRAVATPLNTRRASRSCRACRDERVAPCCPTRLGTSRHVSSRHVTTFLYFKMHGLGSVSCRIVTWRAKWN